MYLCAQTSCASGRIIYRECLLAEESPYFFCDNIQGPLCPHWTWFICVQSFEQYNSITWFFFCKWFLAWLIGNPLNTTMRNWSAKGGWYPPIRKSLFAAYLVSKGEGSTPKTETSFRFQEQYFQFVFNPFWWKHSITQLVFGENVKIGRSPIADQFQRVVDGLPRRTHSSQRCKFYNSWVPASSIPCYSLPWIAPFWSHPIDFLDLDISKIRIRVGWRIWLGQITNYLDRFCISWWWSLVLLHLHSQPRGVISPSHNSELITYRPDKRGLSGTVLLSLQLQLIAMKWKPFFLFKLLSLKA